MSVAEKAVRLLAAGRVVVVSADSRSLVARVVGDHSTYVVRIVEDDATCDCPSYRSRCSHVAAVRLVAGSRRT